MEPLSASDFLPDSYLLYLRTNKCSCNHVERWSELHLVSIHRPTRTRRLTPAPTLAHDLPIGTSDLPVRHVPTCSHCAAQVQLRRGGTIDTGAQADQRWRETLARKYPVEPPKPMFVARSPETKPRPQAAAQPSHQRRIEASLDQL